jgi:hypothetical protein
MKIIEAGHVYELAQQDAHADTPPVVLTFVNREPRTEHPGTQTQEVLRALIDRTMHYDNCLRWPGNDLIIHHLRMALVLHESRALLRKTEKGYIRPEDIMINSADGHFVIEQRMIEVWEAPVKLGVPPRPDALAVFQQADLHWRGHNQSITAHFCFIDCHWTFGRT